MRLCRLSQKTLLRALRAISRCLKDQPPKIIVYFLAAILAGFEMLDDRWTEGGLRDGLRDALRDGLRCGLRVD